MKGGNSSTQNVFDNFDEQRALIKYYCFVVLFLFSFSTVFLQLAIFLLYHCSFDLGMPHSNTISWALFIFDFFQHFISF
jgi:hypothetical protein